MPTKSDFDKISKELKALDETREEAIAKSRDIIRLSKQIIYSLHRSDTKTASELMKKIKLDTSLLKESHFQSDTNMPFVAVQEYVEAACYFSYITKGKIPSKEALNVTVEAYLCGLADLTGELMRKAIDFLINNKFNDAEKIKNLVDEIYGGFLQLDLRNGEIRKKSDSIKRNLTKIQDALFEAGLKRRLKG